MTAEQDLAIADSIRMENQKRQAAKQPPMTAPEIARYRSMKAADFADTAATQDRLLQTQGAVKTTMKGAKLTSGPYKNMDPAQAKAAAISGAAPPGKYAPGRMGSVRGSLTGDSLYGPQPAPSTPTAAPAPTPTPAPTPAPAPAASAAPPTVRKIDPMLQEKRGFDAMPSAAPSAAPQPRKPGLIDGKPSNVWFQEAANRQGMANSYGTVKPQAAPAPAPTAAPPAVRPLDPMLQEKRGFTTPIAPPTAAAPKPPTASPMPSAAPMIVAPPPADNRTPAGRMQIMQDAIASNPPARPAMPLTQVAGGAAPGQFEQAQRNLDKAAATPGPVAIAKGLGTMAAPIGAAPEIIGNKIAAGAAMLGKAGSAVGRWTFGDPAAKERLARGTPRLSSPVASIPKTNSRPSAAPPALVMR